MAFEGYGKRSFGLRLNEIVSPSRPILSIEHLVGRDRELDRIEKALLAPGRNVFIFGERGVGKCMDRWVTCARGPLGVGDDGREDRRVSLRLHALGAVRRCGVG